MDTNTRFIVTAQITGSLFACIHQSCWTRDHQTLEDALIPLRTVSAEAGLLGPQQVAVGDHRVRCSLHHTQNQPIIKK